MADDLLKFDFGFTAVDESELEAVQQITTKASSTEAEVKVLEDKLNKLYNAILPLLSPDLLMNSLLATYCGSSLGAT